MHALDRTVLSPASSSPPESFERRELAVRAREEAIAAAISELNRLHAAVTGALASLTLARAEGAPRVPQLATEPLLKGLRLVREDALRQRLEAAELGERRVAALRAELELASAQVRAAAAQAQAQARAEAQEREHARAAAQEQAARAAADDSLAGAVEAAAHAQEQRPENRRTTRRVGMVAAVSLTSETNFFGGFSSDLSTGGLFIATVERAPVGSPVSLKFTLPGGMEIEAEGEVRWIRDLSPVQPDLLPGVGVAFTAINEASVAEIARFVAEREPMFLPDA